jgi:hypothetical protein
LWFVKSMTTDEFERDSELIVTWDTGGWAQVLRIELDRLTLCSTVPSPPGSRICGVLAGGGRLRIKVHGARKQDDGTFLLEGRALDLTRDLRDRISQARRLGGG